MSERSQIHYRIQDKDECRAKIMRFIQAENVSVCVDHVPDFKTWTLFQV